MTCIVGVAEGGTVWIGADAAASNEDESVTYKTPKVFRRGAFLFAAVHSFRMRDILHHGLELSRRRPALSDDAYLIQYVIEDIRAAFLAAQFKLEKVGEGLDSGAVMIGYHGRLWTMDWDFHLGETRDGYTAIGSGAHYALGSLYTTTKLRIDGEDSGLTPKQRITAALAASAHCCPTVRPPFKILSVR